VDNEIAIQVCRYGPRLTGHMWTIDELMMTIVVRENNNTKEENYLN
jgi:hypothetical protein